MAKIARMAGRLNAVSLRTRSMVAVVGGIVVGVLLIATGLGIAQLVGALSIGVALWLARGGTRWADAWLMEPRRQMVTTWTRTRRAMPVWAWSATVGLLLVVALVVMTAELLTTGDVDLGTLGDFGKGAIALAMMGSLAFWTVNGVPWRPGRRGKTPRSLDGPRNDSPISA